MSKLKVVFMGTPQFSVGILDSILKSNFEVVAAITVADKPAGRGLKLNKSAVKIYCEDNNILVLQPTNLKDEAFLNELNSFNADVFIVVAFRMLPKVVWSMPIKGTFNLHASLLPDYRGSAPINWTIINGDKETGLSTFFIDDKIDTGDVILQKKLLISENESAGELHDRMIIDGSELVIETLQKIELGKIITTKQTELTTNRQAPKLTKENTEIDWTKDVVEIHNLIRGLNPYPGAWTIWENHKGEQKQVKIFKTLISEERSQNEIGLYRIGKKIYFQNEFGNLEILEFQIEGKKKMTSIDWLVGNESGHWRIFN
jgi:methionyl-tRNA formyltransferase